jgi:hypothetical protein
MNPHIDEIVAVIREQTAAYEAVQRQWYDAWSSSHPGAVITTGGDTKISDEYTAEYSQDLFNSNHFRRMNTEISLSYMCLYDYLQTLSTSDLQVELVARSKDSLEYPYILSEHARR